MVRLPLLACLAGSLLLPGCASDDRYYANRSYLGAGASFGYPFGYYGASYFGYPFQGYYGSPFLGAPYVIERDRFVTSRDGRFVSPERRVVCDLRTDACYKRGDIDASETREFFGRDAARRVDRIRDRQHDNDIFLPSRNTVCNEQNQRCFRDDRLSRPLTRRFFGPPAARRLNGQAGWHGPSRRH